MRFSTVIRPASRSPDRSAGGALRTISHPFAFHERHFRATALLFRTKHTKRDAPSQCVLDGREEFDRAQHIAAGQWGPTGAGHAEEDVETVFDVVAGYPDLARRDARASHRDRVKRHVRSEEHTSELQSHVNL